MFYPCFGFRVAGVSCVIGLSAVAFSQLTTEREQNQFSAAEKEPRSQNIPQNNPPRSPQTELWKKMIQKMWSSGVGLAVRPIFFDGFTVLYDQKMRNPAVVIHRITKESVRKSSADRQSSAFFEEKRIPSCFRATLGDYKGSGFDRGHMVPAADFKSSQSLMDSTFTLANICPQVGAGFNRDYWARIESFCRRLVSQWDEVIMFSGPLYLPTKDPTDGKYYVKYQVIGEPPGVAVPTHFFKVVLAIKGSRADYDVQPTYVIEKDEEGSEVSRREGHSPTAVPKKIASIAAFIVPNNPIHENVPLQHFLVPISKVERLSGMSFTEFISAVSQSELQPLCQGDVCVLPPPGWFHANDSGDGEK